MSELAAYLAGAFGVLETMFDQFDLDGAGRITFQQLVRCLANHGFRDDETLQKIFTRVDKDKSNTLDFAEFLVLMYLWAEVGNYAQLIRDQAAAETVKSAFEVMERCYVGYDSDKSRQLSHDEFAAFMTQQLPHLYASAGALVTKIFPPDMQMLSFSRFLYLVYKIVVPSGKFSLDDDPMADGGDVTPGGGQAAPGVNEKGSRLWRELGRCFTNMESDFRLFDKDASNYIDLQELTEAVTVQRPSTERLDILTRIEYYFRMVDVDRSESIDFFEFLYLAFLITQNGSYRDLVDAATDPAAVKECFTTLRAAYRKYDADNSNRLSLDEVQAFMVGEFGTIPPTTEDIFHKLKSSPDRPHIDFVRFMHLLYEVVCPDGAFVMAHANKPATAPARQEVKAGAQLVGGKPPRFDSIDISAIKKGQLLGKGGQGIVYRAEYMGVKCGCKFLLEGATPALCEETTEECQLMFRMDHPNVHFLLGYKAQMPEICMLTELCDNGSLFDCYMKKRMRFDRPTQWRFARECAMGINVLHRMHPPFMHRDIKSLNIFLEGNFACKVADFGMAKDPKVGPNQQGMGTPQWCAPEVLSSTKYDQRADIFSYAVLLWEITHLQVPYMDTGLNQAQIARAVVSKDVRPKIDHDLPAAMASLIRRCWDRDPARRPQLEEVVHELDGMKGDFVK